MRALWTVVVACFVLGASAPRTPAAADRGARIDVVLAHAHPVARHAPRPSLAPFVAVERVEVALPAVATRADRSTRALELADGDAPAPSARGPPRS